MQSIDLAGLLRQSSGAVTSPAARIVHTEGMHAHDSALRFIDLALHRLHPAAMSREPVYSFTRIE
jgi:hypothetical protein